jgi:LacI family transcriptional regulator
MHTAILASSDFQAIGMFQAFHQAGILIPGDISIVGFDDMLFSELIDPPLTIIHQPMAEMRGLAFRHILTVLNNFGAPSFSRLPMEMVVHGFV